MKAVLPIACSLLEALRSLVPGASNRTLRQLLAQGRVRVNDQGCRIGSRRIQPGDVVEIGQKIVPVRTLPELEIVWEDRDLVIIHKPAGLLTVATPHEREHTAYGYLRRHLRKRNAGQKLFTVHRLDKYVSGLLVFAKSEKVQIRLKSLFEKHAIERKYWAIVEGRIEKDRGTIRSRLLEDENMRVHSTRDPEEGKLAITHYRVLRRFADLTSLEVTLETGRKNQIRVHLSEMKHPIAGDRSYGSKINPLGRLALHAFCLGFVHPTKGTSRYFETEPPTEFRRYLPVQRGSRVRQSTVARPRER